ncbi:LysR family transcriptional regulator [Breoghania sp.]|uniref:winged helix-turn-helix domain-containing protein n=1 Tax=Breoghania sp. TaxID=2065378 RepID=UPI0026048FD1|nr:LysR family transcriptional regulator [Breoghania sp.]MDJ0930080.1 LysR family transcriptional regulator [Breoghania sp.]
MSDYPQSRLRIVLAPDVAFGPGKADLLEGIHETGSIRAAGNRLSMSYKRAWNLVGELNRIFREPLVETAKGGAKGGGARLTETGQVVLAHFRAVEAAFTKAASRDVAALQALVAPGAATPHTGDEKSTLEETERYV